MSAQREKQFERATSKTWAPAAHCGRDARGPSNHLTGLSADFKPNRSGEADRHSARWHATQCPDRPSKRPSTGDGVALWSAL